MRDGISEEELNRIYTTVAKEVGEGKFESGLLARAKVESDGDKDRVERQYYKFRVEQYLSAVRKRNETELEAASESEDEAKRALAEREAAVNLEKIQEPQLRAAEVVLNEYQEIKNKYTARTAKYGVATVVLILSPIILGVVSSLLGFSDDVARLLSKAIVFVFFMTLVMLIMRIISGLSPKVILRGSKVSLEEYLKAKELLGKKDSRK